MVVDIEALSTDIDRAQGRALRKYEEDMTETEKQAVGEICHKGYKGGRPKEPLRDPSWDSLRYSACVCARNGAEGHGLKREF